MAIAAEMRTIGTYRFEGPVSAMDPVWKEERGCRMDGIKLVPGRYACSYQERDEGPFGTSIRKIRIVLEGTPEPGHRDWKAIGSIEAYSGIAGLSGTEGPLDPSPIRAFMDAWGKTAIMCPKGIFGRTAGPVDGTECRIFERLLGDGTADALEMFLE